MSIEPNQNQLQPAVTVHRLIQRFREAFALQGQSAEMSLNAIEMQAIADFFEEAIEEISSQVAQGCTTQEGTLDSCALSSHASAMRLLAELGKIEITYDAGRRVLAKWKQDTDSG